MDNYGAPFTDKTPEELVLMLASRDPASEVVDFPINQLVLDSRGRPVQKIRMCILKASQKVQAKAEAGRLLRAQYKNDYGHLPTADEMAAFDMQRQFDDLLACEILVRACRTEGRINSGEGPAVYGAIFESAAWMLDNMSSDELGILFQKYMTVELTCGAREQVLDDDPLTLKRWIDKCKRGLWALGPLQVLASVDLAELFLTSAKVIDRLESCGFPILDPQYVNLLTSSNAESTSSITENTSYGEQPENSTPLISPERARELASQLRSK